MKKFKTYDELSKEANESYKRTKDIGETAKELNLSFSEVFEMLGFKDELDFMSRKQKS